MVLLYQTLTGIWPDAPMDEAQRALGGVAELHSSGVVRARLKCKTERDRPSQPRFASQRKVGCGALGDRR